MEPNGSGPTCRHHEGLVQAGKDHERRIERLENLMERIQQRPPVWVTILISLLTCAVGVLGTLYSTAGAS